MSTKLKVVILSIIVIILAFAGIYYFTSNKTSNNEVSQSRLLFYFSISNVLKIRSDTKDTKFSCQGL